jgi:hypothetical protein
MPVFDFFHWNQQQGDTLTDPGPLVQVVVSMPAAVEEFCTKNGYQIPAPIPGYALIDTGASATAVDEDILKQLSIVPIDLMATSTPSGDGKSFVYPAKITFPGLNLNDLAMARVIGSKLKWQTVDGKEIIMLLGRDLLRFFLMIYNGPGTTLTLSY